ncbi:hypothetical protein, partial [Plasmodium yoelii yoelii]
VKANQIYITNLNEIQNNEDNASNNMTKLERTSFNSYIIPSYIYNNKYKSNLDILLCIYNICLQRKNDSSLYLINYIVNNYNYFYFTHLFFYLIYHYIYYVNIVPRKDADSDQFFDFAKMLEYANCMNVANNNVANNVKNDTNNVENDTNNVENNGEGSLEEKEGQGMSVDVPTTLNNQVNSEPFENRDDIEIIKMEKLKHKKNSDPYLNNTILYDDKELYNFYFCNYDNFEFNGQIYMPIRWFDNLFVKCQNNQNDPDSVEKQIINNNYVTYSDEGSEISENPNITDQVGSQYRPDKTGDKNGEKNGKKNGKKNGEKTGEKTGETEARFQTEETVYYDKFIDKIETILNYMRAENMFRNINRKKIKNKIPTLDNSNEINNNECNDNFDTNNMCVLKNKKNGNTNIMNIYKVNMNKKNVCIVTLVDKFQNKITNTFNRNSIININMNFEQAKDIYTIHADIYLKRIEKIKINTKFINLTTNKLYDDTDIIEKGNSTVSFEEEFSKNSNDNYNLNYTNIINTKIIFEKNVSILYCSNKNVTFILNEQIIPQFKNDLVKIEYFIDINFYCLNKQYNTADLFGVNNNILDNIYNLNFKIPINVIETIYHTYENYSGIHFYDQTISQLENQQLMLKYNHKLLYTTKEDLIKTVIL